MGSKGLVSKIVFFTGVLLIGALLISNLRHWLKHSSVAKDGSSILGTNSQSAASGSKIQSPEKRIIQAAPTELSVEEQKKWAILREIMSSKNDNDPRLDKELRGMSSAFHAQLFREYQTLPMESRNERGLISFLIARDLKDPQDLEFLKSIYDENPCLSLQDCSTALHSDPHLSGIDQTSANYPQLAALYQIEKQLNSGNKNLEDSNLRDLLKQILQHASQFPAPIVQKKASAILTGHPL